MSRKTRSAFTLVELLVIISIIGTLMSLIIPAVLQSVEQARRFQCIKNQSQFALAIQSFHSGHNRYPGYDNELAAGPITRRAGWMVEILSHMDQQSLYNTWTDATIADADLPRPYFSFSVCPSRGTWSTSRAENSYVVNGGFWVGNFGNWTFPQPYDNANTPIGSTTSWWRGMRPANGLFVDRWTNPRARVDQGDVIDGVSNTLLMSENLQAHVWDHVTDLSDERPNPDFEARLGTTFVWLYTLDSSAIATDANRPAPQFYISDDPIYYEAKMNGADDLIPSNRASLSRPSSYHGGVFVVAFADGRATKLSREIEYHVYQQLCTPNGKRSDAPVGSYVLGSSDFEP